jgi:hypothetical protein
MIEWALDKRSELLSIFSEEGEALERGGAKWREWKHDRHDMCGSGLLMYSPEVKGGQESGGREERRWEPPG